MVFVEPETPGNVGALARVMANFGLKELVLVNPCEIREDGEARALAMHAWSIVANARRMSFEEAIEGFDNIIGTTARIASDMNTTRAYMTPRELAKAMKEFEGDICIVFGRESSGLTNEELRKCDMVVHIPCSPEYPTLNITHAAAIIFYELFTEKRNPYRLGNPRQKEEVIRLFEELAYSLNLRNPENAVKQFRNVISRAFISGSEARGIAGVLSRALRREKQNPKKHR